MQFTVDNIEENKSSWQRILDSHNKDASGDPFDTPSDGRREEGSSVRPVQPQEVPDHDFESQEPYPSQPQASRPSQPLEVPRGEEDYATRPSSGSSSHSRGERPETHHRRSSTRSSITSSAQKVKESTPRRFSGVPTTQAAQLVQASKEPRRGSLGNIAPSKSKEGSPRRSSGRSTPSVITSYPAVQNLPDILNSPLRMNASINSIASGDAAEDLQPAQTLQLPDVFPRPRTTMSDLSSQVLYSASGSARSDSPKNGFSASTRVESFLAGPPYSDSSSSEEIIQLGPAFGKTPEAPLDLGIERNRNTQWPSYSTAGDATFTSEHTNSPEAGKFECKSFDNPQSHAIEQKSSHSSAGDPLSGMVDVIPPLNFSTQQDMTSRTIPLEHMPTHFLGRASSQLLYDTELPGLGQNEYSHLSPLNPTDPTPLHPTAGGDVIAAPISAQGFSNFFNLPQHQPIGMSGDGASDDGSSIYSQPLPAGEAVPLRPHASLRQRASLFFRKLTLRRRRSSHL